MKSPSFLRGGGDMGALMRAMDWSQTPLGRTRDWPQSLRTTVSTCLNSRFPILIWWGPQFVKLYNDAYRPMLGAKHPRALGAPGRDVWPEIWHIIGPMLESVVAEGRATWSEDQLLPLERHGFSEECYFTFSYSPIHDESGGVGGVFCAVTETTGRVIGERRLRLLQEFAVSRASATVEDACSRAMAVLARDPADDVPFALMYLLDGAGTTLRLVGATGIAANAPIAPSIVDVARANDDGAPWPFQRVIETGLMEVVDAHAGGAQRAFVIPVNASDGSATGVLIAGVSPHLPVDEQYRGFAALLARQFGGSIAQARALEDEKRRAQALAEIDRAKTAFFSNVSHEFRTPLTLMLSPIEEALASRERTLSGEDLATVHRNGLRLLKLVNTLLDFARIEAGRVRAVFEPTDLARLTADLASAFRSAMDRAGLRFDVECAPLATPIHVDRDMWEKIVLNLLSNALKFTLRGGVGISLRLSGDHAVLEVRDTGIGIPEHELTHLFERFHRVQGADARTQEGSGIGLALVHELVKMHGGTVTAASTIGEGAVFTVAIPVGVAHLPPEAIGRPHDQPHTTVGARPFVEEALRWLPAEPPPDVASATPVAAAAARGGAPRILLADDNADMRRYVAGLLRDRWAVDTVADGVSALASARANRPALVISDVMMPGLDGFELLRELRSDPRTSDVPVIILSARAGEEARIEGLEAGADDYIVKPFSARELRARVEAQLLRAQIRSIEAAHDRRLADTFRHAPLAIAILRGPDNVFEFVNEPYLGLIAHRPVLGRAIREALPEQDARALGDVLDRVHASRQSFTAELQRVMLDGGPGGEGREAFFTFVYQPIRGEPDDADRVAVFAIEVTDLVTARREAEQANRAKDDFLALLGHELRNPLAPILLAVKMLDLKGPDDPALQKLRDVIRRQATQMARLVDDLLDVGRIISGKLVLERERVEVNAIVAQAVETCTPLIEQRRHTLNVVLTDRPVHIDGDGGRLVQVVCNLLNNAAKYMPEGGRIDLSAALEGDAAVIRVRDQGIGIAPEMLDRIFERFVQVDSSRQGSDTGLGIGLSLVKAMIDLHGGSVTVRSDGIGRGSEFTVRLPAEAAAPPPMAASLGS